MSELSDLMPPAPVETLIGNKTFYLGSPNLLKWNAVAQVFTQLGAVSPVVEAFAQFQTEGKSAAERLSAAFEHLLKSGLGEALHRAAAELLMTKSNAKIYTDSLEGDEAKSARATQQVVNGRWVRNGAFAEFIDDNLTALQAFTALSVSANLTQAGAAVGKLLPFLMEKEQVTPTA